MIQYDHTITEVIELLTLERLDLNLFRGTNYQTPWKRIFGGQVLGQALAAAYQSVPKERVVHSLHGYFILPGDIDHPVIYQVDEVRDGGSFSTRRVSAIQKGKSIFVMAASFQKKQLGLNHQESMPEVETPDKLKTFLEQAEGIKPFFPMVYDRIKKGQLKAFDFRPVHNIFEKQDVDILQHVWMKSAKEAKVDARMNHQILAYVSDANLLISALGPHKNKINFEKLFMASLDHAMWFHQECDINDWMLYSTQSPHASNSRALVRGKVFSEEGQLIATVMQEGLIRT